MTKVKAKLYDFESKVVNNLSLAEEHMKKVLELNNGFELCDNFSENNKIKEMINDCIQIEKNLRELEMWAINSNKKTKIIFNTLEEENAGLFVYNIPQRISRINRK